MNTFERLLFLKSMSIFKYVKDEVLLKVASAMEEVTAEKGEVIIEKGAYETSMYMMVTGKAKVHNEENILKELKYHDVFGELAALSPQKRIASVTALEECLLLKISNSEIYDLMETDLAKGIIVGLCKRIRSIVGENSQEMNE